MVNDDPGFEVELFFLQGTDIKHRMMSAVLTGQLMLILINLFIQSQTIQSHILQMRSQIVIDRISGVTNPVCRPCHSTPTCCNIMFLECYSLTQIKLTVRELKTKLGYHRHNIWCFQEVNLGIWCFP